MQNAIRRNSIHDNGLGGIRSTLGFSGTAPPFVTEVKGSTIHGRCVAQDGTIIEVFQDDDLEGEKFLGEAVLHQRAFELTVGGKAPAIEELTATATWKDGTTSAFGGPAPQVRYLFRNSAGFDVIPGTWDHVAIEFRFAPYDDTVNLGLVVEGMIGVGVQVISFPGFVQLAQQPVAKNFVAVPLASHLATGIFDWIWRNPSQDDLSLVGNVSYNATPFLDKGPNSYSCVGLTERAAEEAGFDIVPLPVEYGLDATTWILPFVPGIQLGVLAPGISVLDIAGTPIPRIWSTPVPSPAFIGSSAIPFPTAAGKITMRLENLGAADAHAIALSSDLSKLLGVYSIDSGGVTPGASTTGVKWQLDLPAPIVPGAIQYLELFLGQPLTKAELEVALLDDDDDAPIAGTDFHLKLTAVPLVPNGSEVALSGPGTLAYGTSAISGSATVGSFQVKNKGLPASVLEYQARFQPLAPGLSVSTPFGAVAAGVELPVMNVVLEPASLVDAVVSTVLRVQNLAVPADFAAIPLLVARDGRFAFWPGDEVVGTIDEPDEVHDGAFVGISGMTLTFTLHQESNGFHPIVWILDPKGALVKTIELPTSSQKNKAKNKKKFKLEETGLYRVIVESSDGSMGEYRIETDRALPDTAQSFSIKNAKPNQLDGTYEVSLMALPATIVSVSVEPKKGSKSAFDVELLDPTGASIDLSGLVQPGSEGVVVTAALLVDAGEHRLRIRGFASPTEKVALHVKLTPPTKGTATIDGGAP